MGQKVHPVGIRLGISKNWLSKWFSNSSDFPINVHNDFLIIVMWLPISFPTSVMHLIDLADHLQALSTLPAGYSGTQFPHLSHFSIPGPL